MDKKNAYVGSIFNSGVQVVKAPVKPQTSKGKNTAHSGKDLRSGK